MRLFFLIIAFATILSCGPDDIGEPIKFVNNSASTLYIAYSIIFPDTAIQTVYDICNEIEPLSDCLSYNTEGDNWDKEFRRNSSGILLFFVFDADTIGKYGFATCKSEYKILKRYQYSKYDIENVDRTITYP
jgi:hypothetical protein